eukprot:7397475-Ditylum_brightwellii.AAC.1
MITKHTAAVIIQTNFHLAYQQCILFNYNDVFDDWNNHNDYNNEQKEDEDHSNALFAFLILELDNDIRTFGIIHHDVPDLLDIGPDHDIFWPHHGPDPVFQLKQADLP